MSLVTDQGRGRRRALQGLGAAWLAGLGACASLLGPQTLVLSQDELNQRLARRFPLDRRVLEVFDLHVESAALQLRPQDNRVAIALQLQVRERLLAGSLQARLALSAALQLRPDDRTVRLKQVQVERLEVDGSARLPREGLPQRLGQLVAESVLEDTVVYAFRPEQLERAERLGLRPGSLQVTEAGLILTLVPAH